MQQVTSLPVAFLFVFGFSWVMVVHTALPGFAARGAFPWSPSAVTRRFFMAMEGGQQCAREEQPLCSSAPLSSPACDL